MSSIDQSVTYANRAHSQSESTNPALWQGAEVLVAPMLGPSGNTLFQMGNLSDNGVLGGSPTWVLGQKGYGINFVSGTSDNVVGDYNGTFAYPFTMHAYFKTGSSGESFAFTLAKSSSNSDYASLTTDVGANFEYWPRFGGSTVGRIVYTGETPTANTWYSMTAVSKSSTSHELFVDGVFKAFDPGGVGLTVPVSINNYGVGALSDLSPSYGNSTVSFCGFWNRELTRAEILQLAFDPLAWARRRDDVSFPPSAVAGIVPTRRYYDQFIARSA